VLIHIYKDLGFDPSGYEYICFYSGYRKDVTALVDSIVERYHRVRHNSKGTRVRLLGVEDTEDSDSDVLLAKLSSTLIVTLHFVLCQYQMIIKYQIFER
jgi:hypothetical protein